MFHTFTCCIASYTVINYKSISVFFIGILKCKNIMLLGFFLCYLKHTQIPPHNHFSVHVSAPLFCIITATVDKLKLRGEITTNVMWDRWGRFSNRGWSEINYCTFDVPCPLELVRKLFFDLLTHDYIGPFCFDLSMGFFFFLLMWDYYNLYIRDFVFFSLASANLSKHSIHSRLTLYSFTNSH